MKNKAAQALRAIKSEERSKASKENGKLGGRPMQKELYIKVLKDLPYPKVKAGQVFKVIRHRGDSEHMKAGYTVEYKKHNLGVILDDECEIVENNV